MGRRTKQKQNKTRTHKKEREGGGGGGEGERGAANQLSGVLTRQGEIDVETGRGHADSYTGQQRKHNTTQRDG